MYYQMAILRARYMSNRFDCLCPPAKIAGCRRREEPARSSVGRYFGGG